MSSNRRLLILSCSKSKQAEPGLLPAIDRYDGVSFRLLRKAQREGYWPTDLDLLVLSAKYGLIEAHTPIADYEQRMTHSRAIELRSQAARTLHDYVTRDYREIYIDLGRHYHPALEGLTDLFGDSLVTYAEGRIGERLAKLKSWLVKKNMEDHSSSSPPECNKMQRTSEDSG